MWSHEQLEYKARELLVEIEKHANQLWPNTQPSRLFMCDPVAACELLDLQYLPDQRLGSYGSTATAGLLDRKRRVVLLSSRQSFEAMRFTTAHEVGHYLLHPGQLMFRDRSVSDHGHLGRPQVEWEADVFAASFLMPPKLLRAAFEARFPKQKVPLANTGTICFNLSVREGQYLETLPPGSREFALAIARAQSFAGAHFKSLAQLFSVSQTAMAIRLQETGLVL